MNINEIKTFLIFSWFFIRIFLIGAMVLLGVFTLGYIVVGTLAGW